MFENAPAQLLGAGPQSYLKFLGKIDVKRSHIFLESTGIYKIM